MKNSLSNSTRIVWVDTLKFIGMFSIYAGHFLSLTGLSYAFIFAYGVQVFFFVSGFFAIGGTDASFLQKLKKQARSLLIPYAGFSLLALVIISIQNNYGFEQVLPLIKQSVLGMRNDTPAIALWFLPALFIMAVLYDLLYRICHNKWIVFAISMVVYIATAVFVDPIGQPKWIFSLDSALYFFPFYALGPILYPFLNFKWEECSLRKKITLSILGVLILAVTGCIYFAKMFPFYQFFARVPLFPVLYPFLIACVLIGFLFMLSRPLSKLPLLPAIGQKTLFLCGNETIMKLLVPELLGIAGLSLNLANPLSVYLYALVLILLCYFFLIPIEEKICKKTI